LDSGTNLATEQTSMLEHGGPQRIPTIPAREGPPNKPLVLCLSHLRWAFVWQRPQHLLVRAAAHFDVVVVEEPVHEDCSAPHLRIETVPSGIMVAVPIIPLGTSPEDAVAIQEGLIGSWLTAHSAGQRIFWYYTPAAMAFTRSLPRDLTIYDNMDELSAFRGASPSLLGLEVELLGRADIVFAGGASLYEAKRNRHDNVHCFPSSIDVDHFGRARKGPLEPVDLAEVPRPRLGFFGVVDERFDVDLLASVASLRPDWHFVMIGPVVKIDPALLPGGANIHWLGPKSYDDLPEYLAHWDFGLMPFALNESTRFISPTKTPEFLAAGLPVVSTPVRDVVDAYGKEGLVEIASTAADVVAAVERLMRRPQETWLERVDARLATGSWDTTWAAMQAMIGTALSAASRPAPRFASAT
jgi:glycosyltransferase involved in cell wall biosynthesis